MTGKPKTNWGGARENAGRPRKTLTAAQVEKMLVVARRYARSHGKTVDELLMETMYSPQTNTRDRLWAIKMFKDCTMAKISEDGATDAALGPSIYLPEQRPVLNVVQGGKSE